MSHNDQACVPDLLREALTCLDQVNDADGTVRRLKSKVCIFSWIPTSLNVVQLLKPHCLCIFLDRAGPFYQSVIYSWFFIREANYIMIYIILCQI